MGSTFSVSFSVLIRMSLGVFFSFLTRSWSWAWQCLLLLVHSNQFMTVCLIFPFLLLQNQMLDYSKRSRSGKFRLVTKFKKEKNNKNKETHSTMGLPGTKSAHSLCLFVTSVWSHHCLFLVCFLTHPLLLFHLHLPLLAGLISPFHVAE